MSMLKALENASDTVAIIGVLAEVTEEIWSAREKHGKQADMPYGTGPNELLMHPTLDQNLREVVTSLGDAEDNEDLANLARARCQALSRFGEPTWESVLTEEWAEAMAESDPTALRAELLQVAAMAVSWITVIDGRKA